MAFAFLGFIAFLLVKLPLGNPGNPDDEAPPSAAH
jgi:hypothetical protein